MKSKRRAAADYDTVWKDAIELYFEAFMEFFFPDARSVIDWQRGVEFLDKELKHAVRNAVAGRGHVDKLAKVYLKTGVEVWIIVHIEVQTQRDGQFELRMYVYNYRIFDRYRKPVLSLAILADDDPNWHPNEYGYDIAGCQAGLRFPSAKLCEFRSKVKELDDSRNPFAVLVLAHLKTQETQRNPESRLNAKISLIRGLRRRGLIRTEILELFRLIHGMMTLPDDLDRRFEGAMDEMEKEERMPYMTPWEKRGLAKGIKQGIEIGMEKGEKKGVEKGIKKGIEKGIEEGIEKGIEKGRDMGAIDAARESLVVVLRGRFENISATALKTIKRISDMKRLMTLTRVAAKAPDFVTFSSALKRSK